VERQLLTERATPVFGVCALSCFTSFVCSRPRGVFDRLRFGSEL
jgi:hypothetical protein